MAKVAIEFATRSQADNAERRAEVMARPEPAGTNEKVHLVGHHCAAKFQPPNVKIHGKLREQLRKIFDRKPHVSAGVAQKEMAESHANNIWVEYNVTEERCKRLWGQWKPKDGKAKGPKKVHGWYKWGTKRLKIFVKHFNKDATTSNKTKDELVNMLPTFEEKHDADMAKVTATSGFDSDGESGDEIVEGDGDGRPNENSNPVEDEGCGGEEP